MKSFKSLFLISFFIGILFLSLLTPTHSYAVTIAVTKDPLTPTYKNSTGFINLTFTSDISNTFLDQGNYRFGLWQPAIDPNRSFPSQTLDDHSNADRKMYILDDKTLKVTIPLLGNYKNVGQWTYRLWAGKGDFANGILLAKDTYSIYPPAQSGEIGLLQLQIQSPIQQHSEAILTIININPNEEYTVYFDGEKNTIFIGKLQNAPGATMTKNEKNEYVATIKIPDVGAPQINKKLCLRQGRSFTIFGLNCDFNIGFDVTELPPSSTTAKTSGQAGIPNPLIPAESESSNLPVHPPSCATLAPDGKCINVNTAIGLISTDPASFVQSIFSIVLGLAGGIALILIMISGYRMMASQGNPEALTAARDQLISTIIGLLFIIFSFVILQVIGVDILRIPGFAK